MIKIEKENGFTHTYSDTGMFIKKNGTDEVYADAIDIEAADFKYEETDIPIESIEESVEPAVNRLAFRRGGGQAD